METEKPPDVYVKTVLTIGDKPAPADGANCVKENCRGRRRVVF